MSSSWMPCLRALATITGSKPSTYLDKRRVYTSVPDPPIRAPSEIRDRRISCAPIDDTHRFKVVLRGYSGSRPGYSSDRCERLRRAIGLGETVVVVSGAHGRGDSDVTRALQRATPPAEALAWVTTVTGARSVDSVEPMPGGASLAMHRVTVTFADGDSAPVGVAPLCPRRPDRRRPCRCCA